MFFLQTLLGQGLAGIDNTGVITTMTTIAYTILLISFLISMYQAAMRGGDVRSLGVAAIKYVVVAIVLANWTTVFHDINNAFSQLATFIGNSSGAGDMFSSWLTQLKQQFQDNTLSTFWKLITGSPAALITVLLIIVAYIIFAVALVVLGFFYTLYGCLLYVLGPLVLALMPIAGVGGLGTKFATNFFIWNSWLVLYSIFGALITAIHMNDVNAVFSTGFGGFFVGTVDSLILGIVSIFYAIALLFIPKIAKSIISGDVGVTMSEFVRAGAAVAGTVLSLIAGAAAGGGAVAAGAGAGGGGAQGGAGASSDAGVAGGGGATSSSSPPPQPSLANTISSGMSSALGGDAPPSSNGANPGSSKGSSNSGGSETSSGTSSGSPSQECTDQQARSRPFNRGSVVQTVAFHAARLTSQAVHGNGQKDRNSDEGKD